LKEPADESLVNAQDYRPNLDLLASGADAKENLPEVTKRQVRFLQGRLPDLRRSAQGAKLSASRFIINAQVLSACLRVSVGMLVISIPAREFVRVTAALNMGTSQQAVDRLLESASTFPTLYPAGIFYFALRAH
jgi:hypothetical protein